MRLALLALALVLPAAASAEDFPRRMLVVHAGQPLYLNPLTTKHPDGPDRVRESAERLAAALRIPTDKTNNQLFVLAGGGGAGEAVPTKSAIEAAVRAFCESSRKQDRVLVYLAGHAVVKDGVAYFAPVEAVADDPETLVPVSKVFDLLRTSKAAQKVLVWDVCRRNPAGLAVRPHPGPMTATLADGLTAAPPGVQVIVACSPGEFSLEYGVPKGDAAHFAGSALLDALTQAAAEQKQPAAADAIPVAEMFPAVEKYVASAAKAYRVKQTPRLVGKVPAQLAPPDPKEPVAAAVELPAPKIPNEAKSIFEELALPPLLGSVAESIPPLPFSAESLKVYAADVSVADILKDTRKYSFRATTLLALQTIRETALTADPKATKPLTQIDVRLTEKVKKSVLDAQEGVAVGLAKLELAEAGLDLVAEFRAKEPLRWQAHYDFARAQVKLRLAALHEYNKALGDVRTEALPALPQGATGWQLVAVEKMQSRAPVRKLAEDGVKGLRDLAEATRGTPWEVLSRRALLTPRGLAWEPIVK
jgi:hypothetical protein